MKSVHQYVKRWSLRSQLSLLAAALLFGLGALFSLTIFGAPLFAAGEAIKPSPAPAPESSEEAPPPPPPVPAKWALAVGRTGSFTLCSISPKQRLDFKERNTILGYPIIGKTVIGGVDPVEVIREALKKQLETPLAVAGSCFIPTRAVRFLYDSRYYDMLISADCKTVLCVNGQEKVALQQLGFDPAFLDRFLLDRKVPLEQK